LKDAVAADFYDAVSVAAVTIGEVAVIATLAR
jgi:hypothetical protein